MIYTICSEIKNWYALHLILGVTKVSLDPYDELKRNQSYTRIHKIFKAPGVVIHIFFGIKSSVSADSVYCSYDNEMRLIAMKWQMTMKSMIFRHFSFFVNDFASVFHFGWLGKKRCLQYLMMFPRSIITVYASKWSH